MYNPTYINLLFQEAQERETKQFISQALEKAREPNQITLLQRAENIAATRIKQLNKAMENLVLVE